MRTTAERFWEKVDKSAGDCWLWTAYVSSQGYGRFILGGRVRQAHRVAYVLARGAIPDGLQIDHLCRNRRCVNPEHLEAVTQRENILRGVGFPAIHAAKTHCIRGHEYDGANTYLTRQGHRQCRTCKRRAIELDARAQAIGG